MLYFWQIWKRRISELSVSQDYVMHLQGDCPQYLEGDVSLCEEWAEVSENERYVINAINLENQDITARKGLAQVLTPGSWKKANVMIEPENSQGKYTREFIWKRNRMDVLSVMAASFRPHVIVMISKNVKERNLTDTPAVGNIWL